MIVEYFGVSGVGKSTILKEYYRKHKDESISYPRYELYENNSWFIRNMKKLMYVVVYGIKNIPWCNKYNSILKKLKVEEKNKLLFNGIFLKYQLSKCIEKNITYLFDEGTFQLTWAIYLRTSSKPEKNIVNELTELFAIPNELYVIDAPTEMIVKRLNKRKKTSGRRTKIMESNDLVKKINDMKENLNIILKFSVDSNKYTKIKKINNDKELGYEK